MRKAVFVDRPDLELLRGAIDMHAHTSPALFKRHIDDAALAEYATAVRHAGLRAEGPRCVDDRARLLRQPHVPAGASRSVRSCSTGRWAG